VPIGEATNFGVITADRDGRVRRFDEKPAQPGAIPGDLDHAYCSMGNYLFNTDLLLQCVRQASSEGKHDFGRDVLPALLDTRKVLAYDFTTNSVPGIRPYEERAYWRDVGTIDSYFAANQDLLGLEPRFDLFNPRWPISTSGYSGPSSTIIGAEMINCMLGAGTWIKGARAVNSIIRREVVLERDVEIEDCIIMDYTTIKQGARLRRTIVDRFNKIDAGVAIGYDLAADRERYHVTDSGIVVVPRGTDFASHIVYR
jgi:glucose-1-phosphate adenylyltransferase